MLNFWKSATKKNILTLMSEKKFWTKQKTIPRPLQVKWSVPNMSCVHIMRKLKSPITPIKITQSIWPIFLPNMKAELGSQAITNWKCMKTLKSHKSYKNRRNLQIKEIFFLHKTNVPHIRSFQSDKWQQLLQKWSDQTNHNMVISNTTFWGIHIQN